MDPVDPMDLMAAADLAALTPVAAAPLACD